MTMAVTDHEPSDDEVVRLLADWLPHRRWFPVKGAQAQLSAVGGLTLTDPRAEARVRILLVRAQAPGVDTVLQVPVTLRPAGARPGSGAPDADGRAAFVPAVPGGPAWIGTVGSPPVHVRDGVGDPAFLRAWMSAAEGPRPPVDAEHPRVLTGEQSNTSVILPATEPGPLTDPDAVAAHDDPAASAESRPPGAGDATHGAAILKVFRALAPGDNPDVDVPRALARGGWVHVPRPLGWLEAQWPEDGTLVHGHLAVLSEFVDGAQDGFELACALAGAGESFGALARDLGGVVAGMHTALASALPTPAQGHASDRASGLADAVRARYRWAVDLVPGLAAYGERVEDLADRTGRLTHLPAPQRVHGDLHLGQALRAHGEWFITDFEGEPLAPVAARTRPDLALRDVAGMLRSFDYATAVGRGRVGEPDAWADEARTALLEGYLAGETAVAGEPVLPGESRTALLRALELDKALYEAVYEARNRPDWLAIPLRALDRLLA
jgi:maltokinase